MKMRFVGCGSAFNKESGQSNMVIIHNGKRLLIDCGTYFWKDTELEPSNIDAVYISHLHADHTGGLEELAFRTYFDPNCKRPILFCYEGFVTDLWYDTLIGGLGTTNEKEMKLGDYFEEQIVTDHFIWEGIRFKLHKLLHVKHGKYSYGLSFCDCFVSTDTQEVSNDVYNFDLVFHDCETSPYKSGVHTHYEDLCKLYGVKSRMWLYHYQIGELPDAEKDGFAGFVKKGMTFELGKARQ